MTAWKGSLLTGGNFYFLYVHKRCIKRTVCTDISTQTLPPHHKSILPTPTADVEQTSVSRGEFMSSASNNCLLCHKYMEAEATKSPPFASIDRSLLDPEVDLFREMSRWWPDRDSCTNSPFYTLFVYKQTFLGADRGLKQTFIFGIVPSAPVLTLITFMRQTQSVTIQNCFKL